MPIKKLNTPFTEEDFSGLTREEKIGIMRDWFYQNYEDPAERTPYESAEGGYIYIWGGPYYAPDELSIFYGLVDDDLIEALGDELNNECCEWTSTDSPKDYENSYLSFIGSEIESFSSFNRNIKHVKQISKINTNGDLQNHLLGMLYVNVITSMETYLSDVFLNKILEDNNKLVKFVENNPEFKNKTFKLSQIFKQIKSIEDDVKIHLLGLMWHNINKIKPMFKSTLDINFPKDLSAICKAVLKRHDLVHRGGKNKDGDTIIVTEEELAEVIDNVCDFIESVNKQILELGINKV